MHNRCTTDAYAGQVFKNRAENYGSNADHLNVARWFCRIGAGLLATTFAIPAAAQTVTLPENCTAYLTVQAKSCMVSHHYTCEGDPFGHQWRLDMDDRGAIYASQINFEAEWVYSLNLIEGVEDRLDSDATADRMNFTELLRTGRDDFDFIVNSSRGEALRVEGFDRMTGETVIIDDVPLLQSRNDVRMYNPDGSVRWEARGFEYVSPEWRMFFAGPDEWTSEGETFRVDYSPVEFVMPGEDGFLTDRPKFNCESVTS